METGLPPAAAGGPPPETPGPPVAPSGDDAGSGAPRWGDPPPPPGAPPRVGPSPGAGWGPPPPPPSGDPPPRWGPPPPPGWGPPPQPWPPPEQPVPAGLPRLRQRGVGELIDAAFSLYRRNFLLIVAIAAVVQIPFAIFQFVAYRAGDVSGHLDSIQSITNAVNRQSTLTLSDAQSSALKSDAIALIVYALLVLLAQLFIVTPLSLAATTRAVSDRYLERPASLGSSYRAAFERMGALVLMSLTLIALLVLPVVLLVLLVASGNSGAAALLGIVSAVVLVVCVVRFTVAAQAIVLEGRSGWAGLRRSWQLLRGYFWRTVGLVLVLAILQGIVDLVLTLPISALGGSLSTSAQQSLNQVASAVAGVFVAPISLITLTLLYYDMRIRREAFDLEMLARSL